MIPQHSMKLEVNSLSESRVNRTTLPGTGQRAPLVDTIICRSTSICKSNCSPQIPSQFFLVANVPSGHLILPSTDEADIIHSIGVQKRVGWPCRFRPLQKESYSVDGLDLQGVSKVRPGSWANLRLQTQSHPSFLFENLAALLRLAKTTWALMDLNTTRITPKICEESRLQKTSDLYLVSGREPA